MAANNVKHKIHLEKVIKAKGMICYFTHIFAAQQCEYGTSEEL